ncbi:hypothetical protein ACFQZV_02235 [Microbacterium koreense]|uniref:DUF3039 domain-containing protein n=1 Tax=Microbacterium koreense TaxID=323761 RepID=A0ABW2ZNN5_9MICO
MPVSTDTTASAFWSRGARRARKVHWFADAGRLSACGNYYAGHGIEQVADDDLPLSHRCARCLDRAAVA